jgi:hypothetical protein
VKRCDALERVNLRPDGFVDQHRVAKARPSVHDAVSNRLHSRRVDERKSGHVLDVLVLIDEPELQARRAGVDD